MYKNLNGNREARWSVGNGERVCIKCGLLRKPHCMCSTWFAVFMLARSPREHSFRFLICRTETVAFERDTVKHSPSHTAETVCPHSQCVHMQYVAFYSIDMLIHILWALHHQHSSEHVLAVKPYTLGAGYALERVARSTL